MSLRAFYEFIVFCFYFVNFWQLSLRDCFVVFFPFWEESAQSKSPFVAGERGHLRKGHIAPQKPEVINNHSKRANRSHIATCLGNELMHLACSSSTGVPPQSHWG